MREWKPGDLAMVKCSDGEWRRAMCVNSYDLAWTFDNCARRLVDASTARPLVVIDPEDMASVALLAKVMMSHGCRAETDLQSALRAFVTPPKPDEPTGLGAVVVDIDGKRYIRTADVDCSTPWSYANNFSDHEWPDVAAIRVLSEGVS